MIDGQNRRDFLITKPSAGFGGAVLPVSATAMTTDTAVLIAGEVEIPEKDGPEKDGPEKDGKIPGCRAVPDVKDKTFPVVLVIQEVFGVQEHIKGLCRRRAKAGYLAVAPALDAREGDPAEVTDIQVLMSCKPLSFAFMGAKTPASGRIRSSKCATPSSPRKRQATSMCILKRSTASTPITGKVITITRRATHENRCSRSSATKGFK